MEQPELVMQFLAALGAPLSAETIRDSNRNSQYHPIVRLEHSDHDSDRNPALSSHSSASAAAPPLFVQTIELDDDVGLSAHSSTTLLLGHTRRGSYSPKDVLLPSIRDEKTWAIAKRDFLINTSRAQIQI